VALGDPCGVAAVWVMMGAAADGCNKCWDDDDDDAPVVSILSEPLIAVLVWNSGREITEGGGGWQSRIVSVRK
jgi:hypothetical protein